MSRKAIVITAGKALSNQPVDKWVKKVTKANKYDKMNPLPTKYPAPNNPMKPPTIGNKKIFFAEVSRKSSVCAKGMIVKKDSKSLKVFIAFDFDIYPIHSSV
jgi:hypothetical protein